MALRSTKNFAQLASSLAFHRLLILILIGAVTYQARAVVQALNNRVPVMISGEGLSVPLKLSWDQWEAFPRLQESKGFTRQMMSWLLCEDYRYYDQFVLQAQQHMTSALRNALLTKIRDQQKLKVLDSLQQVTKVTIIRESMQALQVDSGYQVGFEAIVESRNNKDIPVRNREKIVATLLNVPRSDLQPSGFLLSDYMIKETIPEPYVDAATEQAKEVSDLQQQLGQLLAASQQQQPGGDQEGGQAVAPAPAPKGEQQ